MGVERKLNVAAALYSQGADNFERGIPEHLIFFIRQCLAGRDDYRVAGMNADGVEVFHITNGDSGVVRVAYHFVFYLFVALYALFDEHLMHGRERKRVLHHVAHLVGVIGEAAARSAERERGAQDNGIAYLLRRLKTLFDTVGYLRGNNRLAYALTELFEKLSVLGALNALGIRAEQLYLALLENALFRELHRKVESGLTADAGDYRVRALIAADTREVFERQRLHIDFIGYGSIGHYRCGVRVREDDLVALLTQGEARLGSRIVELGSLTDDYRTRADNEHLFYISSLRHAPSPPSYSR